MATYWNHHPDLKQTIRVVKDARMPAHKIEVPPGGDVELNLSYETVKQKSKHLHPYPPGDSKQYERVTKAQERAARLKMYEGKTVSDLKAICETVGIDKQYVKQVRQDLAGDEDDVPRGSFKKYELAESILRFEETDEEQADAVRKAVAARAF